MNGTFIINNINPITGAVNVQFNIGSINYINTYNNLPLNSSVSLNQALGSILTGIQTNLTLGSSVSGQPYSVQSVGGVVTVGSIAGNVIGSAINIGPVVD